MMQFIVTALLLAMTEKADAGVYHCVKENGTVEFRDRPCQNSLQTQSFLPYTYHKTDPKTVQAEEKKLQKTKKKIAQQEKQTIRRQARLAKKADKESLKKERLKVRCDNIQEKIKIIQYKLRAGCKGNRNMHLKEQLLHLEKMNHKYCQRG